MSSVLEKIKVMERLVRSGQLDTSVTRRVQLFRVSTIHEMVAMRVLMEDESGLAQRRNEFVENPWGFPYVPVPRFRRANTAGLRLAPEHISFEWFGHPIYWIDPELTRFREEEAKDPTRWAIRMYFLMIAVGLMRKEEGRTRWVNAIRARGINYTEEMHEQYRKGYETPEIDGVRWGIEDIERNGLTIQGVEEATIKALQSVANIQKTVSRKYHTVQNRAFNDGRKLVLTANDENGRIRLAVSEASKLTKEISAAINEGKPVADFVDPLFNNAKDVIALISEMDRCSMILSAPIIRETVASRLEYATIATSLHNYEAKLRNDGEQHRITLAAQKLINLNDRTDKEEFLVYHKTVMTALNNSWKKLKLCVTNHLRANQGQTPLSSHWEMDALNNMGATESEAEDQ